MIISTSKVREGYKVLPEPGTKDTIPQAFNHSLKATTKNPLALLSIPPAQRKKLEKKQQSVVTGLQRVADSFHKEMQTLSSLIRANKKVLNEYLNARDFKGAMTFVPLGLKSPKEAVAMLSKVSDKNITVVEKRIDAIKSVLDDKQSIKALDRAKNSIKLHADKTKRFGTAIGKLQLNFDTQLGKEKDLFKLNTFKQKELDAVIKTNFRAMLQVLKTDTELGTRAQRNVFVRAAALIKDKRISEGAELVKGVIPKIKMTKENKASVKSLKALVKFTATAPVMKPKPKPVAVVKPDLVPTPVDTVDPDNIPTPIEEASNEGQNNWYGLRARPLSIGAQPKGYVQFLEADGIRGVIDGVEVIDASNYRHGAIRFDKPLDPKLIDQFELIDFSKYIWDDAAIKVRMEDLAELIKEVKENKTSFAEFFTDYVLPRGVAVSENPFYIAGDLRKTDLRSAVQAVYGGRDIKDALFIMWESIGVVGSRKEATRTPPTPKQSGTTNFLVRLNDTDLEEVRDEESFFGSVYDSGRRTHPYLVIVGQTLDGKYACLPFKEKATAKPVLFSLPETTPYAKLRVAKHIDLQELFKFRKRYEETKALIDNSNQNLSAKVENNQYELERRYGPISTWNNKFVKVQVNFSNTGPKWVDIVSIDTNKKRVGIKGSGSKQRFVGLNNILGFKLG